MKRTLQLVLVGVVAAPALAFTFGGWAVITVDDLPEYAVAGKPVDISFVVRQHGLTFLRGLGATVSATAPRAEAVTATTRNTGDRYTATITLPKTGDWTLTLHSGFGPTSNTLLPIKVVAASVAAPQAMPDRDRGLRLFVGKGCVTCHVRGETAAWESFTQTAPILTGRQYPAEYLAAFLRDPEKSPLSKATVSQLRMPNLGLKPAEITALVAFINSDGSVASQASRR